MSYNLQNLKPIPKGKSGNPGGKPKGFGALIRSRTKNGLELVEFALDVLRGNTSIKQMFGEATRDVPPSFRERIDAAKFLAERGWGSPEQFVEHGGESTVTIRLEANPASATK